jgi:hypothetical protein
MDDYYPDPSSLRIKPLMKKEALLKIQFVITRDE